MPGVLGRQDDEKVWVFWTVTAPMGMVQIHTCNRILLSTIIISSFNKERNMEITKATISR